MPRIKVHAMPVLIKSAEVYAPQCIGKQQVLLSGASITQVSEQVDLAGSALEIVDAAGRIMVPGIVDALTHPCGGGGEGGFGNRTAEISAAEFALAGVTSPVGALGTDAITRSLDVLFGCVMSLRAQGLAAYMYSGSYHVPPVTLTGDLSRDIVLVDPVLGVGEVAISDHRSSQPEVAELRRLAADARLGGIIAGKRGVVLVHVGDGSGRLAPLRSALAQSDLPADTFYPTHANRNQDLLDDAIEFAREGATIDFTVSTTPEFIEAGEVPAIDALFAALDRGVPPARLTLSSDAGGSLPLYVDGELCGLEAASPNSLTQLLQKALIDEAIPAEPVIAALTRNPANALGLHRKGRIEKGADADMLMLDSHSGELTDVICGGRWLVRDGEFMSPR